MGKIKDTAYFVVHGWMLNKLNLKGTTLQVFAIIHGFSHSEENEFKGSLQYLCEFTGSSRSTVIRSLRELEKKGIIVKREVYENGVKLNRYKSSVDMVAYFETGGVKMTPPPCQNDTTPGVKMTPHNIVENNIKDNIDTRESKDSLVCASRCASDDGFAAFWAAYPKKKSKGQALSAWKKLKPDSSLQALILKAIEAQKRSPDWQKDKGKYIPYPATWLNAMAWEDEMPAEQKRREVQYLP